MCSMLWLRPDVEAGTGLDVKDDIDIRSPLSPVVCTIEKYINYS